MRVLLFEFVSGGGWWKIDPLGRPASSLLREGKTMLASLAADFAACAGCEVVLLQDRRVKQQVEIPGCETVVIRTPVELFRKLREYAPQVDYGVVVAPEFADHLYDWSVKWRLLGGQLLGCSELFIRVASSKIQTAARLSEFNVPVPNGLSISWPEDLPDDFPYPAILKPDDGAGSQGLLFVRTPRDGRVSRRVNSPLWRLERYCPGMPVSVSVMSGPAQTILLPACLQWLSDDKRFRYRGGMTPLAPELNERAHRLAQRVIDALPATHGYFGIDLILGDADDGRGDVVIEVNPRLTTSYVGLRTICHQNLAQAMLDLAQGRSCDLSFDDRRVQFTPDGQVVALS
jgi:predicted ATP-grasp superfamily ATP-dependent carboligase